VRFDATAWHAASDALLDTLRGGFDFGGGLAISFGFMRSVTINGDLVSQIRFNLPDLSHITVDQAKLVSDALTQAHIIQNGAGNSAPASGTGSNAAPIASVPVASTPVVDVPSASAPTAVVAPTVSQAAATISPPSVSPLSNSSLGTGVSSTIVQNSLSNQILQSLTVIDTGVNSLGILRAIHIQGALRDALLGAIGNH
jgi:hypothetical protein